MELSVPSVPPRLCTSCGAPAENAYTTLLCASCRDQHLHHPFPRWVQGLAVGVAALVLLALVRFPSVLLAARSEERGKRAEQAGNWNLAEKHYQQELDHAPGSPFALAHLIVAKRALLTPERQVELRKLCQRLEGLPIPEEILRASARGTCAELQEESGSKP